MQCAGMHYVAYACMTSTVAPLYDKEDGATVNHTIF